MRGQVYRALAPLIVKDLLSFLTVVSENRGWPHFSIPAEVLEDAGRRRVVSPVLHLDEAMPREEVVLTGDVSSPE